MNGAQILFVPGAAGAGALKKKTGLEVDYWREAANKVTDRVANESRAESFRPEAAADAWQRAIAFLSRELEG